MKHLVTLAIIMLFVSGVAWGQKPVNKADILLNPEWKKIYDAYKPDAELIANLKNRAPELKADVYFGYWCDDSKNNVPVFLKILDTLNVPEFKVNFYEVEKKATADQKYYVEDKLVEKVPTFIFYANDFEMGRIVENPKNSILQDMMIIVF
ncbi:MAG TPA: thioredoxin family protein [Acidobacteriota bacterium]